MEVTRKVQLKNNQDVLFHPQTEVDMVLGLKKTIDNLETKMNMQRLELAEYKDDYGYDSFFDRMDKTFNLSIVSNSLDRDDKLSIKENTFYNIKQI